MRWLLSVLMIGATLAAAVVALSDAVRQREVHARTAVDQIGFGFEWPNDPGAADPETAQAIIAEAADVTASNVIRKLVVAGRTGKTEITFFIQLGRQTSALFTPFTLAQGRWLTRSDMSAGAATISTTSPGAGGERIGVPAVLAGAYHLTFAPLQRAFDSIPVTGQYVLEAPDGAARIRFFTLVNERLAAAGSPGIISAAPAPADIVRPAANAGLVILPPILIVLAALLVSAIVLRSGKRIGVLRLCGHSIASVWYLIVGRLQIVATLVTGLGCVAGVAVLPGADLAVLGQLLAALLGVGVLGITATAILAVVIISRVRVTDLVKGRL